MTYNIGDPNHLGVHNDLHAEVASMAEQGGIEVDLPPQRLLGDLGHTDDHNKIVAALEAISTNLGPPGRPPAPLITNQEGGAVTYFTSGGEGDEGPTLAYTAKLSPFTDEVVEVEVDEDMSGGHVLVTNAKSGTDYTVSIYAVNAAGRSDAATTDSFQLNYNDLFGGTTVTVDDYLGTGQKWAVHSWEIGGTYSALVKDNPQEFHLLVVGGGATGADWTAADHYGPAGGGGGFIEGTMRFDKNEEVSIVVAAAKSGGSVNGDPSYVKDLRAEGGGRATRGSAGGTSGAPTAHGGGGGYMHPDYWLGGGGGGSAGNGSGASAGVSAPGGAGLTSTITGQQVTYARGGQGGCCGGNGSTYNHPGSGGGAGRSSANTSKAGIVVIAYQIGVSTSTEIAAARAVRAAREEAYQAGLEDGQLNGYTTGHAEGFAHGYGDAMRTAEGQELQAREAEEASDE